ncbi:hypothetical protein CEXT_571261 [Caerostris extrusa]|uniref:Uncharacterized protein n=1 Tax=Caerostris extrusa TaxID=172846 RepID=A0AAV4NH93_CAEEX|nr:hypothetical protein CEXT_571261 [Caerostris extrusa]
MYQGKKKWLERIHGRFPFSGVGDGCAVIPSVISTGPSSNENRVPLALAVDSDYIWAGNRGPRHLRLNLDPVFAKGIFAL